MKTRVFVVFAIGMSLALSAMAQSKVKAAEGAADGWLKVVDSGNYAQSWDDAATYFKAAVSKEDWKKMLGATRTPLGKVVSRELLSAKYTTQLPGAPDGEYVVIQYESSFEHKKAGVETVTAMLDKDGRWRVGGYFIK
ncbi:MAG: DUF4019 domain-containing protein [Acidobacteriia bacterium]|nr:DUF4019 domain-containing protein [Terriglobia bacterium]